jgi:NOL1/NOP2/sun family putative RNA methylase
MKIFFLRRYEKLGHKFKAEKVDLRQSIRVNTLKTDSETLVARLSKNGAVLKRIPFVKDGFFISAPFPLSSTPEYLLGHFYIQEAASQVPVEVLAPRKGDAVLDMCACPGSKTTQIAAFMEDEGVLVALDLNPSRLEALRNNLERCGVENSVVFHKDAQYVSELAESILFDRVLLDAPCSGNFVIEDEWFDKRSIEDIKAKSRVQRNMIREACCVLKKGGTLVYSTCSLEPEEDEEIVEWALDNLPLSLDEIDHASKSVADPGATKRTGGCLRFWPDKTGTQGFFVARFKKK